MLGRASTCPSAAFSLAAIVSFLARAAYEGVLQVQQRNWLRGTFGSYVSQEVLQEIMAGKIHSGLDGARVRLCILFADIHNFSERSENGLPAGGGLPFERLLSRK